jgi:hypothetical protein
MHRCDHSRTADAMLVGLAAPNRNREFGRADDSDLVRGDQTPIDIYKADAIQGETAFPTAAMLGREELRFAEHEGQA